MKKLIWTLAMALSTQAFAFTVVEGKAELNQKIIFSVMNEGDFVKKSATVTGNYHVSVDGETAIDVRNETLGEDNDENLELQLYVGGRLKIIDRKEGIEKMIPARVSYSQGKIKRLSINGLAYKALYDRELRKTGYAIFGQDPNNRESKLNYTVSDFECTRDWALLKCEQKLIFNIVTVEN